MKLDNPLLTLFVLVYNNEKFVEDAVKSALSQTYSPLEIIISDDNSHDSSYEIIRELTERYEGPHTIIINRNEVNKGICGHINKIVSISNGKYLIVLAGDDVAEPDRVESIYNHLLRNKNIEFISTDYYRIEYPEHKRYEVINKNVNCKNIYRFLETDKYVFSGATSAYSKELFNSFGNLNEDNFIEDKALAFRAFLKKRISYLNCFTVSYRVHSSNLSQGGKKMITKKSLKENYCKWYPAIIKLHDQHLKDLDTAAKQGFIRRSEYDKIKKALNKMKAQYELRYKLELYWIEELNNYNILMVVKLLVTSSISGVPLSFIISRLYKKLFSSIRYN